MAAVIRAATAVGASPETQPATLGAMDAQTLLLLTIGLLLAVLVLLLVLVLRRPETRLERALRERDNAGAQRGRGAGGAERLDRGSFRREGVERNIDAIEIAMQMAEALQPFAIVER